MSKNKKFNDTDNMGIEGRDEGSQKLGELKVKHQSEDLKFQMALDYLQQVLETARGGNLLIETDGKSVNLTPAGDVDLAIKAKHKGERQSLSFTLTWNKESKPILEENVQGDACVVGMVQGIEEEAGDYEDLERRFEQELFGGCGCVAIPGS